MDFDGMSPDEVREHLRQLAAAHALARAGRRPEPVKSASARAAIAANHQRVHGVQARIEAERERKQVEARPPKASTIKRVALVALRHLRAAGWHRPLWFWEYGEHYDRAAEAKITKGRISIIEAVGRGLQDVVEAPAEQAGVDARARAAMWLKVHLAVMHNLAITTDSEPYISAWESQPDRTQAEVIRALAAVAMFSPNPVTP